LSAARRTACLIWKRRASPRSATANPNLAWNAGYYEAQHRLSAQRDSYGELRIGGPLCVIGDFNRDLGWATTNNDPLLWQVYAVAADSTKADG
jgi:acyl-homoserine-lactone acylase